MEYQGETNMDDEMVAGIFWRLQRLGRHMVVATRSL